MGNTDNTDNTDDTRSSSRTETTDEDDDQTIFVDEDPSTPKDPLDLGEAINPTDNGREETREILIGLGESEDDVDDALDNVYGSEDQ